MEETGFREPQKAAQPMVVRADEVALKMSKMLKAARREKEKRARGVTQDKRKRISNSGKSRSFIINHGNFRIQVSRRLNRSSWDWKVSERGKLGVWNHLAKGTSRSRAEGRRDGIRAMREIIKGLRAQIAENLREQFPGMDEQQIQQQIEIAKYEE